MMEGEKQTHRNKENAERERENDDDKDILCGKNIQEWLGGFRLALN